MNGIVRDAGSAAVASGGARGRGRWARVVRRRARFAHSCRLENLTAQDVPHAPILGVTGALAHHHAAVRQMVVEVDRPAAETLRLLGRPGKFQVGAGAPRRRRSRPRRGLGRADRRPDPRDSPARQAGERDAPRPWRDGAWCPTRRDPSRPAARPRLLLFAATAGPPAGPGCRRAAPARPPAARRGAAPRARSARRSRRRRPVRWRPASPMIKPLVVLALLCVLPERIVE
jgi:hypothetical protein